MICIEDLSLQGMCKLWGRKVADIAWHQFTSIVEWHCMCPKCGTLHDRDDNASRNIEKEGLRIFREHYEVRHRLGKEAA
jgi:transposase